MGLIRWLFGRPKPPGNGQVVVHRNGMSFVTSPNRAAQMDKDRGRPGEYGCVSNPGAPRFTPRRD